MQARPADERRLVRTLDSNARAFLSDRYRPLDHDEILERVLPALDSEVAANLAMGDRRECIAAVICHFEGCTVRGDLLRTEPWEMTHVAAANTPGGMRTLRRRSPVVGG